MRRIAGRAVALRLQVRRFFCPNSDCGTRTFAEQVDGLTLKWARRTNQLASTLVTIGLALAGRAGARLAGRLGIAASRDTLLRLVRGLPDPPIARVEVLGVDDLALHRLKATETNDFYRLIVEHHRKASTVITSNPEPPEILTMMADPLLAQSAMDRLQSAASELVVEGESTVQLACG